MLQSSKNEPKGSKCYFSCTRLKSLDKEISPNLGKQPFSSIQSLAYAHTIDLILPEEVYELTKQQLENVTVKYSRVFMSLLDIISGDFFNVYIKTGNILMRSEGRALVDNLFTLRDGILRLELDRPTYERCGLVGSPIPDGGRKHAKQRFLVELNLRLPSMLHGKKGFERIVWAFKNVLNSSLTWLFVDMNAKDGINSDDTPIKKHHPFEYQVQPVITRMPSVLIPAFPPLEINKIGIDHAEELFEWLGLVVLNSPRIRAGDEIDPFLCRYEVPRLIGANDIPIEQENGPTSVVKLRWHSFASTKAVLDIFLLALRAANTSGWIAVNVSGFDGRSCTVLGIEGKEYFCWECD
ncbi:hypothetical protein NA57DRAFT_46429 [Rhizodiscina lignyota]|uniref:Uncharacterized protein n=1 Tax=Rhizodiscina lignyota TaxID=1504668 RepID=A0A9P4I3M7_9PEZI|nr:hypothetical protein NA57DRAFT_46429 [Rhizodiscina lignyota]